MSPADEPQAHAAPRSTDSPTLWLSLALGSLLLHLLLFSLASLVLARTAKVELDPEPISVEFVDPTVPTAQATTPKQAIAALSGASSQNALDRTQVQPHDGRSQPLAVNRSLEQPFIPPKATKQKPLPVSAQRQQPHPATNPLQPQAIPSANPRPQQPSIPTQPQGQPNAETNPSQNRASGSVPNPGNSAVGGIDAQKPAQSGNPISQLPQGEPVTVSVSNPRQPSIDVQRRPAQPIGLQKTVLLHYSPALAKQTIRMEATLTIDHNGSMLRVEKATLLPSTLGSTILGGTIEEERLKELAEEIFTQWQFEPAQNSLNGKPLVSPESTLMIDVQLQLP